MCNCIVFPLKNKKGEIISLYGRSTTRTAWSEIFGGTDNALAIFANGLSANERNILVSIMRKWDDPINASDNLFTAFRNDLRNFPNFAAFLKTNNNIDHAKAWWVFYKAEKESLKTNQSALAALMGDFAANLRLEAWLWEDVVRRVGAWEKMIEFPNLRKNVGALEALSLPKGSRPNPSTYLDGGYISSHLAKFDGDGVSSRIVTKDDYLEFGVGKPDVGKTEFVAPKSEIDDILNLPVQQQADKLGIPVEQLQNSELVRIDFTLNTTNKVEMPSGNEWGANDNWVPGGQTSGGVSEAIIKTEGMQLNVDYVVNDL